MLADELMTLWDTTGDKLYVNRWAVCFVAVMVAILVWHKVWGRRL